MKRNSLIGNVVPYLWGIETFWHVSPYQEHDLWTSLLYLTYEELKRCILNSCFLTLWLYLTYEELKRHSCKSLCTNCWGTSCTLPMRNWNSELLLQSQPLHQLYLTYEELKLTNWPTAIVVTMPMARCTLPMRNWNFLYMPVLISRVIVVPYLWGIETFHTRLFLL